MAKDQNNVFYGAKKMKVTDVAAFKLVDEELRLYVDGHQYYDRYVNPLAFDIKTFELIPLSPDNRLKQWKRYKPALSIEHALMYSNYAVDKNGLYWRNPTTNNFITLEKRKIADLLHKPENEKNQDVQLFINENPAIRTYNWHFDSLSFE